MAPMWHILSITSPIFLLLALGYFTVWHGIFKREDMLVLGKLLVDFLLPALVCRAITQYPIEAVLNLRYLGAYGAGSVLALGVGVAYGRWGRGYAWPQVALTGMGMSASNTVFVGFPIVRELLGAEAALAMVWGALIENLLVLPSVLLLSQRGQARQQAWRQALQTLGRNPIIWAILAGLAVSAGGTGVPHVIERSLNILGTASSGVALLMIGGILVGQKPQGMKLDLPLVVGGKLLLHPLCVAAAVFCIAPDLPLQLRQAAVLYACMPLPALFSALAQRLGHGGYAATLLVASTVVAFFSVNAWIWLVMHGIGD